MDAVECLGNVSETKNESGLGLAAFLYDVSLHKYLLYTGTCLSESCLLFTQRVADHFPHAFEDHLLVDLP